MFYRVIILVYGIVLLLACNPSGQQATWSEDIAPLIHRNCSPCHMKGEAAPIELITYSDIVSRQKLIRTVVVERSMPPWPADPLYVHFANERYLNDDEISLLLQWMDHGCVPGDSSESNDREEVLAAVKKEKPDLIVKVPQVSIPGNNKDLFLVMKIPFEVQQDTFIRAIEFIPGNRRLVHHVNTHLLSFNASSKKMKDGKLWVEQDQANSQTIHRELGMLNDDGSYPVMTASVSNYLPGAIFGSYPPGIGGYYLTKQSAFYLNDLHYGPTPVEATDSSEYRIYFAPKAPERPVQEFQLGTLGIAPVVPELIVPAGAIKTFHIEATIPEQISVLSVIPHMHLIGKRFLAYAVKPSGDTVPLIRINDWDFRWQYFYRYKHPVILPRGTRIYVEGVYDNTSSNPNNPNDPPCEIRDRNGSMKTTDEMFQLIVTFLPYQKGDEELTQE